MGRKQGGRSGDEGTRGREEADGEEKGSKTIQGGKRGGGEVVARPFAFSSLCSGITLTSPAPSLTNF